MAKNQSRADGAKENRNAIDSDRAAEDAAFKSDRDSLKKAQDGEGTALGGHQGAGDYANLHFGEQNLNASEDAGAVKNDGEAYGVSNDASSDIAALSIEGQTISDAPPVEKAIVSPGEESSRALGVSDELPAPEETTEGEAFDVSQLPENAIAPSSIDVAETVEQKTPSSHGLSLEGKDATGAGLNEQQPAGEGDASTPPAPDKNTSGGNPDTPSGEGEADADANAAPTDIVIAGGLTSENMSGAFVAQLSAVDADEGDLAVFSIVEDGSGLFEVLDNQLKLKDGEAFDFEAQNIHELTLRVTDSAGNTYDEQVSIDVADINEAPVDIALSSASVAENIAGGVVGALSVFDPDAGDSFTFTVSDDRFEVVDNQLKLKDGVSLDAELTDSIDVTVTAMDSGGLAVEEAFTINTLDQNEVPVVNLVSQSGLQASYYNIGHSLSDLDQVDFAATPDAEGVVDSLDYMQGQEAFWDGAPGDYFAAKYEGQLVVNEGGSYTFNMASDDGSMLFIDGVAVLDNDGLHGTRTRTVSVELEEGAHEIEVRYFENGGSQTLQLAWSGPDTGGATEVIGGDSFEHGYAVDNLTIGDDAAGAIVAELSVTDPDVDDVHTFAVSDDRFEVVEDEGAVYLKLKDGVSVDYEVENALEVEVTVTDAAGASSTLSLPISVEDSNAGPSIELLGGEGLQASYYNIGHALSDLDQVDFAATPDAEGVVDSLDYMQGQEAFWDGAPGDYFAAKYEGQLVVNEGGSYTFNMASDDGSMLFIDGVAVLDNDGLHSTRTRTVSVELEEGAHEIEVRYFENGGSQTLQLAWSGPDTGGATEVIGDDSYRLPGFEESDRLGVVENTAGDVAARLSINDAESDVISVSVDDDRFEVVQDEDGYALKLKDSAEVDYETESEISVTVTATDEHGESSMQAFSIPVVDADEAPVDFTLTADNRAGSLLLNQDGGNDDAAIAYNLDGFPTDALTVEVRFSSDQTEVGNGTPLFSYAASDGSNNEALIWLEGSSGNMSIFLAGQKINTGVPNASLLDGEEHQVSFTWDQGSNDLKVYVDGDVAFETSVDIRDLRAGGTLAFGQEQDAEGGGFVTSQIFEGEIAEVRIFDYARSDVELSDHAGAPINDPETEPGLINNWVMNGADGGVVADLVGADDLQLVNGAVVEGGIAFDDPTVLENNPGAFAGTLSATEPGTGEAVSDFAIVSDPSGAFEIIGNELSLKDGVSLDHETQDSYEVVIEATGPGGESTQQTFTVAVADQNEAPIDFELEPTTAEQVLSLNQDGGTDDAAIASNLEGFPTDALTVEVRFSSDQTDVGNGTPLFSYAASDGSDNEVLVWLEGSSGNLNLFLAGQKVNTGVPNESLLDGEEHQVSFTWDQGSNDLKVYVDGDVAFETSVDIRDLKTDGTLALGQEQDSEGGGFVTNQVFEGEIAEVRIFDYARSDVELSDHAGAPINDPGTEPGLINNWVMNASDGGVVADLVGADDLQLLNGAEIENSINSDTPLIAENDPGAVVGVLSAADRISGEPISDFAIADDPSGAFEIVGNEVKLKDGVSFDYETQQSYDITVEAIADNGETTHMMMTVEVDNVIETNYIDGTDGNDTLSGTTENDIVTGGGGNDELHGGDGSDVFIYEMGDGSDVINGGAGWTDVIELHDGATSLGQLGTDWTVELTEGSVVSIEDDAMVFTDDASGIITTDDGSIINFSDIEQITF